MKNLPILLICLILLSQISIAQEINYYVPTTTIYQDGSTDTKLSITLSENIDTFEITVFNMKPETLKTNSTFPGFTCETQEKAVGTLIICDTSGSAEQDRSFSLEFDNKQTITQDGSKHLFEQEFLVPYTSENTFIKVILPEGTVIQKDQQYLPISGAISSDGRHITVFWRDENVATQTLVSIKVPYEPLPFTPPIELIIIVILLLAIVLYLLNKRRRTPSLLMPILKTDEKQVLKGVINHGDGVNQRILVRESGYSKAKVSKVLKSLAERGIVTLERVGRTNRVHINRDIGKKEQNTSGNN
jgi:uncharacterized membrane protein